MTRAKFVVILFLGLSSPIFGYDFLFPITVPDLTPVIESALTLSDTQLNQVSSDLAQRFSLTDFNQLDQNTITSIGTKLITAANDVVSSPTPPSLADISKFFYNVQKAVTNTGICALCQLIIALIQLDITFLPIILQIVCEIYIVLSTQSMSNFCSGIVKINMPSLKYLREHSTILDPQLACTIILQTKECHFSKPALSWTSTVSTSPKILPTTSTSSDCTQIKVLHITDFHISMNYKDGSVVDCGYPVCCLNGLGNPLRSGKAGHWGDYKCDVAPAMFIQTLKHISETHPDIVAIFYSGDIIDHTIWNTTVLSNTEVIIYAYKKLLEIFPNTPVFPVIGNHEYHPTNVAPPTDDEGIRSAGLDQQWLYDLVAELWTPWLSPSAVQHVKKYGYYSHNYSDKLKIIGLNSNLCYCYNWWLLYNTTFLIEHLDWLNDELVESELNGQRVYIVGHNSMGNGECIEPWESSYNKLVARFAHIIIAQLVGHTHTDEDKIFFDEEDTPVNVAWNGASLTTFQDFNPNYKIMHVCSDTWEVMDIDTYIFNMTEANLNPNQDPEWFKLYSMKSAYDMPDLSPKSYDQLCDRMAVNYTLRNLYWEHYVRNGDASRKTGCNDQCQHEIHCKMPKTESLKQIKPYCQ